MALSEADKKRIEEEEYRKQLNNNQHLEKPQKKGSGCIKWLLIIFIGFPLLLSVLVAALNPAKQLEKAKESVTPSVQMLPGSFDSYDGTAHKYEILYSQSDTRYSASFQPFLKNDDKTLIQAILAVIGTVYGPKTQIDPKPTLEMRNGVNLIKFRSDRGDYFVMPIKEDTGEIHSLIFWKE